MCGPLLFGSVWWAFPLVGMLICLGLMIFFARFASKGAGFGCMGGHHAERRREAAETRQ